MTDDILYDENLARISVTCPHCHKSEIIKIPESIINESLNVTTLSIPMNFMCEHSFQVFVDKHFNIRGYQRVDFDISNLEIYSDGSGAEEDLLITYTSSVAMKKIIQFIREKIKIKGIFGGLVITDTGHLIFSSLPHEISFNMIKNIELQKYFSKTINQVFLIFSTHQKMISSTLDFGEIKLIITLFYSAEMDYNTANYYFIELRKEILIYSTSDMAQTSYWLYSIISQNESNSDEFFLDSLGIKIQKAVVKNADEINEILKNKEYIGKIFLNERYVKLMEGLIWTINDALLIISNLNMGT